MVQVINIDPLHEPILAFLYPEYSLVTELSIPAKFILRRDIKSPREMSYLKENYDDCVVISSKLYDDLWDVDVIREKVITFRRLRFGGRKRTLTEIPSDDPQLFVNSLVHFMFTGEIDQLPEDKILELFNSYGSVKFMELYCQNCEEFPKARVFASVLTFVSSINKDSTNIFYKKKYQSIGTKLERNLIAALDTYKHSDSYLNDLWFFQTLVR